jgi:hypothetical protein
MKTGNRAILEHERKGTVYLFGADQLVRGTSQKNHRWVGEFSVVPTEPILPFAHEDADMSGMSLPSSFWTAFGCLLTHSIGRADYRSDCEFGVAPESPAASSRRTARGI